ncbi:MAG TPA: hypothetical protein VEW46_22305 [Pyrinomonadaceae bacterium]|nr:hypothetical protein [Pyrinomonadaceae bacterium]
MKILVLMLCILCGGVVASAQSGSGSTDSPDLAVVKFSWSKERTNWQQDPFSGPIENFDEMRVRSRNEKRIADAKRGGNGSDLSRAERDAKTDAALTAQIHKNKPGRYQFLYSVQVRNNGAKVIKAIDWDYVFFDLNNQSELGRRQFRTEEKIAPGKSKELKSFIRTPPTQTVSIHSLDKNERANLGEAVVIVRVEYLDGSVWQLQ